jgi:hypothetical protein
MRSINSCNFHTRQSPLSVHRILSTAVHKTKRLCGAAVALALLVVASSSAFAQTKLTPVSLSFGSMAVGATSNPKTAIFKNSQKTAVMISTIAISGGDAPSDYNWGGNCPISPNTLGPGLSCGITVTFTPSAFGNRIAELTVSSNSSSGSQSVALSGVGIAPVTVAPTSLVFPNTLVGATSAAKTATLTSHLNTNLVISSVTTSGDFGLASNGCSSGGGPGAKCTIGVTFAPSAIGSRSGALTINYAGFGSPLVLALKGTGNDSGLTSIAVTPASPSIPAGTIQQFTATGHFKNGNSENLTAFVTWSSAKTSVATITSGGLAKGVTAGTDGIVAMLGSVSGSTTLTVTAPALVSIAVAPVNPSVAKGATVQFMATGTYTDGSLQTITNSVTWSSSMTSVATIATGGLATGVATGTSNITAALNNIVSPADSLTVTPPVLVSIAVTPANSAIAKGTTEQFMATGVYSDGSSGDLTSSATWSSSNPTAASISTGGLASANAPGVTAIAASFNSISGSTSLTVNPAVLNSITVTPSSIYVGVGSNKQYTATGIYSDGSTSNLTNAVAWSSSNPLIATIMSTGLATSTGGGAAMINATQGALTGSATMNGVPGGFVSCDSHIVDMNILVVSSGESEADFPAITQALTYIGTPYTVLDISQTGNAIPSGYLSDGGCHGYFQGVIFAFGNDRYNISNISALDLYESQFSVRQVNWYVYPDPNFGLASPTGSVDAGPTPYNFYYAPAANAIFPYANVANPVGITNAFISLSSAANGSTPLLTDASGNVLAAIYSTPFAGQYLSLTFDSNQYLLHDQVLAYGLVNWVTQGVFLGDYHVYATPQVDDFFIDDSEWIPGTTCQDPVTHDRTKPDASNLPVFRVNAADMTQLAAWQNGLQTDPSGLFANFELTLAFNGVGTAGNGDWTGLTAPVIATSANGGLVTFTTTDFSGLPGAMVNVTGTTNDGGAFNGIWTILSIASDSSTTPATTQFTVMVSGVGTVAQQTEGGATAAVPDDLVANLQSYQGAFHWISHTYDHPTTLNGLCQSTPTGTGCGDIYDHPATDDIDLEVLTNLWVASNPKGVNLDNDTSDVALVQLTFSDFNPANMVTPGVTGLNDPNVPGYLNTDGIQYVVTDTSVIGQPNNGPNPSPNVGIVNSYAHGIYEVPRHPNNVYYNVANWNDDQAEFDCIYSYPTQVPPYNTYTAAQILNFVSSSFLSNMLIGDMDPEMFHQPDLHFSINTAPGMPSTNLNSSLLSDTYNQTFSLYKQLYNLPVLSPTLDQLGQAMQNRNAFNLSNVTASIIGVGGPNATISITMPASASVPTAVIPVTGLNSSGAENYGGQFISHISMTAGQTITLPLP